MSAPHYPEGGYIGKVTQQALVKAGTGTPQFVIRFTVERFWNKATKQEEICKEHYERTIYRAITAKSAEYVKQDLDNLGFTGTSFKELDPNTPNHFDFTGKEIRVFCKHEADTESNMREKWGISQYAGSFDIEGEPVTDFAALDELIDFSGNKAASPKAAPKKAAPAGATNAGSGANGSAAVALTDDELAAKVVELVRSKGNTLAKKSLGVNLLTLKLGRDAIKKAQEDAFLGAYDQILWRYDGSTITVE